MKIQYNNYIFVFIFNYIFVFYLKGICKEDWGSYNFTLKKTLKTSLNHFHFFTLHTSRATHENNS